MRLDTPLPPGPPTPEPVDLPEDPEELPQEARDHEVENDNEWVGHSPRAELPKDDFPPNESSSRRSSLGEQTLQVPPQVIERRAKTPFADHSVLDQTGRSLPENTPGKYDFLQAAAQGDLERNRI